MTRDDFHASACVQDNTDTSAQSATPTTLAMQPPAPKPMGPQPMGPRPPAPRPPMPRGAMLGSTLSGTPFGMHIPPVAASISVLPIAAPVLVDTAVVRDTQDEE